jgi:hypothetical protein
VSRIQKIWRYVLRHGRKLSALGPISLVRREEPAPRAALDTLCRYLKLVNASLIIRVEDADNVVIIREDLLPTPGLAMRQSVELAVGSMFGMLSELIGQHWQPLEVCSHIAHPRTCPHIGHSSDGTSSSIRNSTAWSAGRATCPNRARLETQWQLAWRENNWKQP